MDRNTELQLEDAELARLLQAVGRREPMPEALKESWESAFRRELALAGKKRRAARRRIFGAIAAAAVIAALAVGLLQRAPTQVPGPAVRVVAVSGPGEVDGRKMNIAEMLQPGSVLRTGAEGRIALSWDAYDLRLDVNSELALTDAGVELRRGRLYASDEPLAVRRYQLSVATPHGIVRDIGTQFLVSVNPDQTETIVRRGEVVVDSGSDVLQARAEADAASRVVFDSRQLRTSAAQAHGVDWDWIYTVTPAYALEGKTADQFLRWSTGESGLSIEYDSARAAYYARATTLHGSLSGLDPEQAVEVVLATTDLRAERDGHLLRLSLRSSAPASE
jgi:ferric-dicitrate binding protein FerR (iron transport regulator)